MYNVISADSHVTEPADLWLNYIEARYRDRAPRVVRQERGDVYIVEDKMLASAGGLHGARFKVGEHQIEGWWEDVPSSGWVVEERLKEMALDHVDAEVLYPTIAMRIYGVEDVDFLEACIRAYNSWLADHVNERPDKLKGLAVIGIENIENAVDELRRARKLGLVGALIPVFPDGTQPYQDPVYEPFWATAAELEMPISLHLATERRPKSDYRSPGIRTLMHQLVQPVLVDMIYAGVFDRHPNLQVISAENDAGWAGNIIERMDYVYGKARARNVFNKEAYNKRLPSEYLRANVSYSFQRDHCAMLLRHYIGVDRLLWGSDFPHGDATWPDSQQIIAEHAQGMPDEERHMIFCANAARMYGFSLS